jgi:rhamnulokinase
MSTLNILGMDYGASNGRGFVGIYDGNKLCLREVNRFSNTPITLFTGIYWNIIELYRELINSVINAKKMSVPINSIGIDSWAQDFGIIDRQGNLLGFPYHYRDPGHIRGFNEVIEQYSEYELFQGSGIIPYNISTLFQLVSMKNRAKSVLECGHKLLFIPGILSYFLTGEVNCDSNLASVTAMYSIPANEWRKKLLSDLGLPDLLPDIIEHSKIAGRIVDPELKQVGVSGVPVIMVPQHDTASAFTAISAYDEEDTVYVSCGTWGIMGVPTPEPQIDRKFFTGGFCNELGYGNQNYLVKNTAGLWVLQECIKEWTYEGYKVDYGYLDEFTENNPARSLIDLDDGLFMQSGNMNAKIKKYCELSGQVSPSGREEVYSCITYSLADKISKSIEELEILTCKKYKNIHIVGGGSKSKPLCKIIKRNTGKHVIAGPHEATVIGNILAQLVYWNEINSLKEMKDIITESFPVITY